MATNLLEDCTEVSTVYKWLNSQCVKVFESGGDGSAFARMSGQLSEIMDAYNAAHPEPEGLESTPVDPAIRQRVAEILKRRGFPGY